MAKFIQVISNDTGDVLAVLRIEKKWRDSQASMNAKALTAMRAFADEYGFEYEDLSWRWA